MFRAISSQISWSWSNQQEISGVNKGLITQKIEETPQKFMDLLKSLGQSPLKFNDFEGISKQLIALIKH